MNWIALRTVSLLLAAFAASFGDTLVVPNNQATAPGNLPISVGANASRYQEIVGSGQFAQPLVVTGIRLRSAPGSGRVNFNYTSLKITFSTTQAYPNTNNGHTLPSAAFASNVGPDATTVFNAQFSASSPGCVAPGPCAFDMLISLATPFSYDPSKGRLLLDIVTSATNGAPTGNLDGVAFPDSSTSTVAIVSGDPTQAMGSATLAGLVLGLVGGTQVSTSLSGTFGFLIHSSFSSASANGTGLAVLGLMNFDGAGNPGGTYIYEVDSNSAQVPKTTSGVLTGTYSSNPDGIGSVTMALDVGINLTLNTAIAENGQSLRLLATDYQFPSAACGCNVAGMVLSGIARSAPGGSLNGSYGFDLTILPNLNATTGVATYDGAGNVTISATFVSPSDTTGKPTPPFNFNLAGTYATNPDGTGTISLAAVLGVTYAQKYAFVISDKGAGLLLIQLDRAGNGVQFGTAGSSRTPRSAS